MINNKNCEQTSTKLSCSDTLWCFDGDTNILFGPECQYPLPPKHSLLLSYLVKNQHRFVKLEEIHNEVWRNRIVTDTAIRKVIVGLKKYLKAEDNSDIIENRRALGYRLNIPMAMKITNYTTACCAELQIPLDNIDVEAIRSLLQEQRQFLMEHLQALNSLESFFIQKQSG